MPKRLQFDFRSVAPRRSPDWRWTAAVEMHSEKKRARCWEDPVIREAARYLRALADRGDAQAIRRWPDLHAAHLIYQASDALRDELEARLITGVSFEVIAAKCGIAIATVAAFERIFFNVANLLKANDWMMIHVIKIIPGQPVTVGQAWKYLGLAGGPVLLDLMIDSCLGRPDADEEKRTELATKGLYIVREFATGLQLDSAAAAIVEEGRGLFPHLGRTGSINRRDQILANCLQFLRMALGLAPLPEQPVSKKSTSTGQRNAQKDKRHGRPQTAKVEIGRFRCCQQ